jgi:hypothetical protein
VKLIGPEAQLKAANNYNAQEHNASAVWKIEWDMKETERVVQVREKFTKGEATMLVIKNERIAQAQSAAARGKADGLAEHIEMETEHYAVYKAVKLADMAQRAVEELAMEPAELHKEADTPKTEPGNNSRPQPNPLGTTPENNAKRAAKRRAKRTVAAKLGADTIKATTADDGKHWRIRKE